MQLMRDFEIFRNGPLVVNNFEGLDTEINHRLNDTFDDWKLVTVPISHEFIDDLTEITKYEYRRRLNLSDVYEILGIECSNWCKEYYWEKDENGVLVDSYLP